MLNLDDWDLAQTQEVHCSPARMASEDLEILIDQNWSYYPECLYGLRELADLLA